MAEWCFGVHTLPSFFFGGRAAAGASLSEWLVLHSLLTSIALLVHALLSLDASLL